MAASDDISAERRAIAFVAWPSAPLTERLVRGALASVAGIEGTAALPPDGFAGRLVQWATYDSIDHDRTHAHARGAANVLSSSYVFRKALIRKHYLSRAVHAYVAKHPRSALTRAVPRTWELELSFADELEDMWVDELWDLGEAMERSDGGSRWWILKPGMADRGMGIRLFDSKDALQEVFEGFEEDSNDEGEGEEGGDETAVTISQLRHFVIQEYIGTPLLLDPREVPLDDSPRPSVDQLEGHKFHLRVYCVASGALQLYLYTRILALFSSKPYAPPQCATSGDATHIDLSPHLTNTSLQAHRGEEGVRLFDELVGCHILSGNAGDNGEKQVLTTEQVQNIQDQMADALAEVFKAALESPVHFQPLPNAFELFGVDFLVSHEDGGFQVKLLEVNAEPAIELTGPRLTWILEDLFMSIAEISVRPFVSASSQMVDENWKEGETRHYLRNCLDTAVRGATGW